MKTEHKIDSHLAPYSKTSLRIAQRKRSYVKTPQFLDLRRINDTKENKIHVQVFRKVFSKSEVKVT